MDKKAKKTVSIRLDTDLYERLQEIAEDEGRTINRQIAYWIRNALWAYEQEK